MAPRGWISHSLRGLLTFCLPVGLSVWLVYSVLIRPALVSLLPTGLASSVKAHERVSVRAVLLAALAVTLGAATHIIWDGFTHSSGWAVGLLPILSQPVIGGVPAFKLGQHGSTLVGGAIVLGWIWHGVRKQPLEHRRFRPGQLRRSLTVCVTLAMVAAVAAVANGLAGLEHGLANGVGYAAVGAMIGLAIGLLLLGLLHHLWRGSCLTGG